MGKLSNGQKKALSDFLNNISVAILTTGVVIPIFSKPTSPDELLMPIVFGFSFASILIAISLIMVKNVDV